MAFLVCLYTACEEAFCDEEELWQHATDLHIEQLIRQASRDAGLETWKPFWKSSVEAAHEEVGWKCTTNIYIHVNKVILLINHVSKALGMHHKFIDLSIFKLSI